MKSLQFNHTLSIGGFMRKLHACLAVLGITVVSSSPAVYASNDKGQYDLFSPTPTNLMRDLSTDRPDQTESPFTVDAGHFQIEADIVKYTYDRYQLNGEDTRTRTWNVAPVNLKAGLTNNTDLQIVLENYVKRTDSDKAATTVETADGLGDVTIRLKHNFWGNDGGKTAFALMPYIKVPTNQNGLGNNDLEGGLIAPLAIALGDGYGMGLMTQVDILKDADDRGYHPAFVNSVTFAAELTEQIGSYYEVFTERGTDVGDRWVVSFDAGITYAVSDNIQLDAGANIGLTEAADDFQPFVGATFRF